MAWLQICPTCGGSGLHLAGGGIAYLCVLCEGEGRISVPFFRTRVEGVHTVFRFVCSPGVPVTYDEFLAGKRPTLAAAS